jgi:hypothetical protein
VCLRVTVQEEKRRPTATVAHTDRGFARVHERELESFEHAAMNARTACCRRA